MHDKILKIAKKLQQFKTRDIVNALNGTLSRQHVSRIIHHLVNEGLIVKSGSTAGSVYNLVDEDHPYRQVFLKRYQCLGLEEHMLWANLQIKLNMLHNLSDNLNSLLFYVFTEILNNAIEHSRSQYVSIMISKLNTKLTISIEDYGIGVFHNVMKERNLNNEYEAMQDLLKGKTTTNTHSHSGEGIFFSSKAVEFFALESYGYSLKIDNLIPDVFFDQNSQKKRGTRVTFVFDVATKLHLNQVFEKFITNTGEVGFDKTNIKVKLYTQGSIYISRSQARRIISGLDKFKTIILDFEKVTTVGQAFADEIFRVFKSNHPGIVVQAINTLKPVQFMIDRVDKP
ncbi:histidine kinase [Candidatus Collierbacteria bacterium CG17_big_fil_post_rev_8_21_14_2_50_45_7]|uniref:Histidine kinase n=1 Tax=Candidatus Collierbacteria bacterium CG17_big_fil_post_rev_8_21_14_2_50_45_7 TaxID=1974536 RepID=A0A2M7FLV6_9BACT|nr:MAG: histidine kinase [Candidatus Collierbacteria bacterium CG17_big_fil_post_rev_8_21_14_2_50_45_7]